MWHEKQQLLKYYAESRLTYIQQSKNGDRKFYDMFRFVVNCQNLL